MHATNANGGDDPTTSKGWPDTLSSSLAWEGSDLAGSDSYVLYLTVDEDAEIKAALQNFKTRGLDGPCVNQTNFPLPTLKKKLDSLAVDLHEGKGFCQIKGLNPTDFSLEDGVVVYLGIVSYIADRRARQDDAGNMLVHVHNATQAYANLGEGPPKYSKDTAPFHTDTFCDIVAFMMQGRAASGGDLSISSCSTLYSELHKCRPDVVEVLAKDDWVFNSQSSLIASQRRPILFHHEGHLMIDFARQMLLGHGGLPWTQGFARISMKQLEALETVESIAQAGQLTLSMEPGDITLLNNHAVLHSRSAFKDSERHARHLFRLWLRNSKLAWKLPPQLEYGNARLYDIAGPPPKWELAPVPQFPIPWNQWSCSP